MKITTSLMLILSVFQAIAQEPVFNEKVIVESTAFTTEKIQMKDGSYFFTTGHITGTVVTFHVYRIGPDGKKQFEISNKDLGVGTGKYAMVYNKEQDDALLVILGAMERNLYPVTIIRFENNNSHFLKTTSVKSQVASVIFTGEKLYLIGMVDVPRADRTAVLKYDLHSVDYASLEITSTVMNMPKLEERKNAYYYSPVEAEGDKILFARCVNQHSDKSTTMGELSFIWFDITNNKASDPVVNMIDTKDKFFLHNLSATFTAQNISNALDLIHTPLFTKNPKDGSYVFYGGYMNKTFPIAKAEDLIVGDVVIKVSKELKKEWITLIPYADKLVKNKDFSLLKEPRKRFQSAYFTSDEILVETNAATSKSATGTLLHHLNKKDGKLVKTEEDLTSNLMPMMIRYATNAGFKQAQPNLQKVISKYQSSIATYHFNVNDKYFLIHCKETKVGYQIYAVPLK
ncbi:MAG: hypothetical protein ACHQF2_04210 [Flavobacteriales bacterium]